MAKRFTDEQTLDWELQIFMAKVQACVAITYQANKNLPYNKLWDKIKEELVECVRDENPSVIREEK
jgi:hypothetical protein